MVVFAGSASVCIPRRPAVFHNGHPVDGMLTTSALGRYTFSWVGGLLKLARDKNRLNQNDLPAMDHYTRAKDLSDAWGRKTHKKPLWIEIFLAHKTKFIRQWGLTLIQAFGIFAPQFITFHILQILEKRIPGQAVGSDAWLWVVTLTVTTIAASWIEVRQVSGGISFFIIQLMDLSPTALQMFITFFEALR